MAQPVTFATMRMAGDYSAGRSAARVEWYAAAFPEDDAAVPDFIRKTRRLNRSVLDVSRFQEPRKLPLIRDILDALFSISEAEYFIYTNTDIALQPFFYETAAAIIGAGTDAFVINRRTITDRYRRVEEIPLMAAQAGEPHKGYDCFIFRREIYPRFILGDVCVGTAWMGRALLANMARLSLRFREFRKLHATFHIGDALSWRDTRFEDYRRFNEREYLSLFQQLEERYGVFSPEWRSYLLDTGAQRFIPEFES